MHTFVKLLFVTTVAIASDGLKIEQLNELEGLRFEEIGKIKLIMNYATLGFHIDVKSVETLILNQTENLSIIKEFYNTSKTRDEKRLIEIERLITNLELQKLKLNDILYGLIKSTENNENKRMKRGIFSDGLSAEDGRKIEMDLKILKDTINEVILAHDGLKGFTKNATELLNDTIDELGRRAQISTAIAINDEVERKVNAIIKMLTNERLNGDIITITEFLENIESIRKRLNANQELPYNKMAEYYYNLRVTHKLKGTLIKLQMDVPFVEKSPRTLYKIIEFPARSNEQLILTDVVWKYIAINSNESMMLMSLDPCYKAKNSVFYCETESPLKSTNNTNDCVTNALVNKKIDIELCKIDIVKSSSLTFIRLSDGQYFYYTPTNETLNVTCKAHTSVKNISAKTSGILELEPECRILTSGFKLIRSMKYQEDIYKKDNILSVSFDIGEVKENIKKYNTSVVDSFYIDSLNKMREMYKPIPDTPQQIKDLNFVAKFGNMEVLQFLLMIALMLFIVHVFYRIYMWCLQNCKCLKVRKENECKKNTCDV